MVKMNDDFCCLNLKCCFCVCLFSLVSLVEEGRMMASALADSAKNVVNEASVTQNVMYALVRQNVRVMKGTSKNAQARIGYLALLWK